MISRSLRMVALSGAFGLAVTLLTPAEGRAAFNIAAGYDLFQTVSSETTFSGLGNLQGVPLGSYNFGGSVGTQNTGYTDTIIQRNQAVTGTGAGSMGTTTLTMDALQLETVAPTNFMGLGVNNYFVTLQSVHGGPASTGSLTATFNADGVSGTFSSSIDVFFDVRVGSLTGSIVYSGDQVLTSDPNWSTTSVTGAILINGVNNDLNGQNNNGDFWSPPFDEAALLASHGVSSVTATVLTPEPASVVMLGMGVIGVGAYGWRRRGRAA
jgi:hypothetical protein